MGISQTMLRVPPLRGQAAGLLARIVGYLDSVDWVAPDHNTAVASAPFNQTPEIVWSFVLAAVVADRARFQQLHDGNVDLPYVEWLPSWMSARDQWMDYYKYNLGNETTMTLCAFETDPALYREHLKSLEVTRDVTQDHMNAWFDAVYAIAVPTAVPALSPAVENELQRWCLRSRRDFPITNSQDPTIQQAPDPRPQQGSPAMIAALPIPIEKRPCTDFLWQRDPWSLDQGGDPHYEEPGVDLVLPYWAARSFGLVK
jgi:hypothetical protein